MNPRPPRQGGRRRARLLAWMPATAGLALLGPAATPALASCGNAGAPPAALSRAEVAHALRCLVDEERRAHGLGAVRAQDALTALARGHAFAMARRGFFAHGDVTLRVRRSGYAGAVGEALVWGRDGLATPASMVSRLLASPTHRVILLAGSYSQIGIGVARGAPDGRRATGAWTVALDLGAPV